MFLHFETPFVSLNEVCPSMRTRFYKARRTHVIIQHNLFDTPEVLWKLEEQLESNQNLKTRGTSLCSLSVCRRAELRGSHHAGLVPLCSPEEAGGCYSGGSLGSGAADKEQAGTAPLTGRASLEPHLLKPLRIGLTSAYERYDQLVGTKAPGGLILVLKRCQC